MNGAMEGEGVFEVIESFAIRRRKQFYLIGTLKSGKIEEGWYVNIPFNRSLSMTVQVSQIEEVEMASETEAKMLLIVNCDDEGIDLLLGLNVGLEYLPVTKEGVGD